jgi:hypothetical protein
MKTPQIQPLTAKGAKWWLLVWTLLLAAAYGLPYAKITLQGQAFFLTVATTYPGRMMGAMSATLVAWQLWQWRRRPVRVWLAPHWVAAATLQLIHILSLYWHHIQLFAIAPTSATLAQRLGAQVQLLFPFYAYVLLAVGAMAFGTLPNCTWAKNAAQ